jgi:hypothetical protein
MCKVSIMNRERYSPFLFSMQCGSVKSRKMYPQLIYPIRHLQEKENNQALCKHNCFYFTLFFHVDISLTT